MSRKIVVALGGNAILVDDPSAAAQKKAVEDTSKNLVKILKNGDELVVTHGNGPQVGNLLLQHAASDSPENPAFPLDSLVAMTEGSIGYWLQNALQTEVITAGLDKNVATVVTQVIVDENDPAMQNPTKPIGPFYTEEKAKELAAESGDKFVEDAGRGYRKVVPSPKPVDIKEFPVIKDLVDQGHVVIAAGGGGIPVVSDEKGILTGIEAVIDKDFASQKLAEQLEADLFVILTGVDNVYVNFNKPDQKKLEEVTVDELKAYIEEDQFAPGSMLPKVEAAIRFVENSENGKAVITSLENLGAVLEKGAGTVVTR